MSTTYTPQEIKINDDYLTLVPRLDKLERSILKESIRINGLREPIIVNESGEVLDGHTRFEICQELRIKPEIIIRKFPSKETERDYVIGANLERRQLNKFAKVELVYNKYREATNKSNIYFGGHRGKMGYNAQIFAERIGMSHSVFHMCVWLIEHADKKTKSNIRNGNESVKQVYLRLKKPNYAHASYSQNDDVRCPYCKAEFKRKELIISKRIMRNKK